MSATCCSLFILLKKNQGRAGTRLEELHLRRASQETAEWESRSRCRDLTDSRDRWRCVNMQLSTLKKNIFRISDVLPKDGELCTRLTLPRGDKARGFSRARGTPRSSLCIGRSLELRLDSVFQERCPTLDLHDRGPFGGGMRYNASSSRTGVWPQLRCGCSDRPRLCERSLNIEVDGRWKE